MSNLSMYKGFSNMLKAKVVSIEDPLNRGRVQVYIPCYHGLYDSTKIAENKSTSQYPWAQVCTFTPVVQGIPTVSTAGNPDVTTGQWVWIEYEGGDSRTPIVVGTVETTSPQYDYVTGTQAQTVDLHTVVTTWANITKVVNCNKHVIGLKSDGTVVAAGDNTYNQCDVSTWTGITNIYTNRTHTVGLLGDGTVIATGNNTYGQCNVTDWTNVGTISIGEYFTIGIRLDGAVLMTHKE